MREPRAPDGVHSMMNLIGKFFSASLAVCICFGCSAEASERLEEMSDRSYLPKLIEKIGNAKESIDVSMYQILLSGNDEHHPVSKILKALAEAKKRGVKIRALLNRHLDYVQGETAPLARSVAAYEYLARSGIEVVFSEPSRRLHDKVIIIDTRWVIEGSMNWTKTALTENWESATLIDSPEYAARKLLRVHAIPSVRGEKLDTLGDEGKLLEIPAVLMIDKKLIPDLLRRKDETIFEFYVWLLKERMTSGTETFILNDETLFRQFGLDPLKGQKDKRREAVRLLKKLAKRGLIDVTISSAGADPEVTLRVPRHREESRQRRDDVAISGLQIASSSRPAGGTPRNDDVTFPIPLDYFNFDFPKRLPLAAEFVYLLARLEMSKSASAPWWWRSQEELTEQYHLHQTTLSVGTLKLQRENVLEIVRDDAPEGRPHSERLVNRYRVNRLMDPVKREEAIRKLAQKSGAEALEQARAFANMIDEPNDVHAISTILDWMKQYPASSLSAAFDQVSRYERNNPRRSLDYLRGILEGMKTT